MDSTAIHDLVQTLTDLVETGTMDLDEETKVYRQILAIALFTMPEASRSQFISRVIAASKPPTKALPASFKPCSDLLESLSDLSQSTLH